MAGNSELSVLLPSAKEGDEKAFSRLLELYSPLISASVKKYSGGLIPIDEDDLRQEATISFYKAVLAYVDGSDTDFGHYAKICVERGLISHIRMQKRRVPFTATLDEAGTVQDRDDPAGDLIERERVGELNDKIRESLSDFENMVWSLHISGMSPSVIAESLGRDVKSINNALRRIRVKLRRTIKKQ